jgi:enoyl-CoA hydratase/carnithine racemase
MEEEVNRMEESEVLFNGKSQNLSVSMAVEKPGRTTDVEYTLGDGFVTPFTFEKIIFPRHNTQKHHLFSLCALIHLSCPFFPRLDPIALSYCPFVLLQTMTPITNKLLASQTKNLGVITLNNPNALHALTHDMMEGLEDIFREWKIQSENPAVNAILLKSSPAKRPSFCAGGDVKAVYQEGMKNGGGTPEDFFFHEYRVNHAIATTKIPIVSLWDGVVMGGGAGISVHGRYRVATENSLFAMPECAIGLFPDVGSMWWMTRLLQRPVANFLALTGQRIYSADLVHTGLATHYAPSNQLVGLEAALVDATATDHEDAIAKVLGSFHETIDTSDCHLAKHEQTIHDTFGAESVEDIVDNLYLESSDFSQAALEAIKKQSPTSLKVTLEGLKRGATCTTIDDDLKMEYRMAKACVRPGSDFYEGIRSVLIDRDHAPKWNPATIEAVTQDKVEKFFAPIENEWTAAESLSKL